MTHILVKCLMSAINYNSFSHWCLYLVVCFELQGILENVFFVSARALLFLCWIARMCVVAGYYVQIV